MYRSYQYSPAEALQPSPMDARGRRVIVVPHGSDSPNAKLTDGDVIAIRQSYKLGAVSQPMLAKQYGVSQSLVWNILHRKAWAHLP